MATNERLTQLPVEVVSDGTNDLRLTQVPIEVASAGTDDLRLTQVPIEVVSQDDITPAASRVTETGANTAQQDDEVRVTETGASAAQQSDDARVTEIGLYIILGASLPPPECPGELGAPRIDGITVPRPATNCPPGGDGTLGPPRTGAHYEPSTTDAAGDSLRPAPIKRAA